MFVCLCSNKRHFSINTYLAKHFVLNPVVPDLSGAKECIALHLRRQRHWRSPCPCLCPDKGYSAQNHGNILLYSPRPGTARAPRSSDCV